MSRDYTHEEWIPWYVRDTAGWLELSLAARGAAEGIARKMNRAGDLHLGSRGLHGLTRTLGARWEELEPALAELLREGPNGEPPRLVHDRERSCLHDQEAERRRRPTSTDRVAKHRAKSTPPPSLPEVTGVTPATDVTVTCVPSNLISSDLISDLKIPEEIPSARAKPGPDDPPPWWAGVLATLAQTSEAIAEPGTAWLRYRGHRSTKRLPPTREDALYWLPSVIIPEQREARQDAADKREREDRFAAERASRDRQRAGPNPADPQKLTASDQEDLARRVPMPKRQRGAA